MKLRPPPSRQAVLKPPSTGEIVLRPPPRKAAPRKAAPGPGLRPALDAAAAKPAGREVQLGSWRSEAEARVGWGRAVSRAGGALDGLTPRIVAADLPGRGRYYRLRTATANPVSLCETLQAVGQDCLRARD